jgi:hypothetical protein
MERITRHRNRRGKTGTVSSREELRLFFWDLAIIVAAFLGVIAVLRLLLAALAR